MEHKALTINHRLESFVYVDDADRTGATGFSAGDVGRISYQTDTGQYWRLTAPTPTWALIGPPTALPAYASAQLALAVPTAITGTTQKMFGMGSTAKITPSVSGKLLVTFTAVAYTTGGAFYSQYAGTYGTVASGVPVNGAASTGTSFSNASQSYPGPGAPVTATQITLTGVVTGLTVGTQYWFDIFTVSSNASGVSTLSGPSFTAVELP